MGKDTAQIFFEQTANGISAEFTIAADNLNKNKSRITIFVYGTADTATVTLRSKPETTIEETSPTFVKLNKINGSALTIPVNSKLAIEVSKGDYDLEIENVGGGTSISAQIIYDN